MAINSSITYGEVEEFFSNLLSPETPKIRKYHVYGMYQREQENEKKVAEFENAVTKNSEGWRFFGSMIGEDMCIVTGINRKEEIYYIPTYKDKENKIHVCNTYFVDFDEAVLACVIYKKTDSVESVQWVCKLINN